MGGYGFSSSQCEELVKISQPSPAECLYPQAVKKARKPFFLTEGGSLSSQEGSQMGNLL